MTEIEIETIRLALDTEITHKDYAKHNLDARKILNNNEIELKQGQTLPIHDVSNSLSELDGKLIPVKFKISKYQPKIVIDIDVSE